MCVYLCVYFCCLQNCDQVLKTVAGMQYHLKQYHVHSRERRRKRDIKKQLAEERKKKLGRTRRGSRPPKIQRSTGRKKKMKKEWSLGEDGWKRNWREDGGEDEYDYDDGSVVVLEDDADGRRTRKLDMEKIKRELRQAKSIMCPVKVREYTSHTHQCHTHNPIMTYEFDHVVPDINIKHYLCLSSGSCVYIN